MTAEELAGRMSHAELVDRMAHDELVAFDREMAQREAEMQARMRR